MISREDAKEIFVGPLPTVCTPFNRDDSIDYATLAKQVDIHLSAGAKTLILTYGDSLYSVLTDQEVAEVTKAVAEQVAGRATVVAADRRWATGKEVEFAQYARSVGADILMVAPPDWALSCTATSMAEHYCAVAEHIPVMIVTMAFKNRPMEFVLEMIQIATEKSPRLVAIKDDVIGECSRHLGLMLGEELALFSSGTLREHLSVWPYGFRGYLSNYIMFKPDVARIYWDAVRSGDTAKALDFIVKFDIPFWELISGCQGGTDAGFRGVLELFGTSTRWRRRPYYSLSDAEMEKFADFFKGLSML